MLFLMILDKDRRIFVLDSSYCLLIPPNASERSKKLLFLTLPFDSVNKLPPPHLVSYSLEYQKLDMSPFGRAFTAVLELKWAKLRYTQLMQSIAV